MTPAAALMLASSAALLIAGRRSSAGAIEAPDAAGPLAGGFDLGQAAQAIEAAAYNLTTPAAMTDDDTAARNIAAFLQVLRQAEGTDAQPDPYRVTFGYRHVIQSLADHPTETGEWAGLVLSDGMCSAAGFGPGCRSTAAGAYQIIRPTWRKLRDRLGLVDFGAASQDAAAVELLRQRGALGAVEAGDLVAAVRLARHEWASLPGNTAKQQQRPIATLAAWFNQAGGTLA